MYTSRCMEDFDNWNEVKKATNDSEEPRVDFSEREVWWCKIGKNIGREEDGKHALSERPVLIYKKFNKEIFFGIPLSSMYKNNKYYFLLSYSEISSLLLSQLRVLDAKRLIRKLRVISKGEYEEVRSALSKIL